MEERRLELKVGVLLVLALLGCVGLLYLLGELEVGGGARVTVDFTHSGGVPDGAPVKLAGVRVGRVTGLKLLPGRRSPDGAPLPVQMQVEIGHDVFAGLRADSQIVVATQGPLGEPFLEIVPGSADAGPLQAGAVLRGNDPPRLDLMMTQLSELLNAGSGMLSDEEGLRGLVRNANGIASRAQALLDENGPRVTEATRDLTEAARDLKRVSAIASQSLGKDGEARRILDNAAALTAQLRRDVPAITARAQQAADTAAQLAGSVSPEDVQRIKAAIASYEQAGAHLAEVSSRAEKMLARIEAGEGTLGQLANDPQLYQDLKALVTDLKRHPWKVFWKN